jgi:hypothetical protein
MCRRREQGQFETVKAILGVTRHLSSVPTWAVNVALTVCDRRRVRVALRAVPGVQEEKQQIDVCRRLRAGK